MNKQEPLVQPDEVTDDDINIFTAFNSSTRAAKALDHLMEMYYDVPCYNSNDTHQPYDTFYREGQRDVIGYIFECIKRVKKERIDNAV